MMDSLQIIFIVNPNKYLIQPLTERNKNSTSILKLFIFLPCMKHSYHHLHKPFIKCKNKMNNNYNKMINNNK